MMIREMGVEALGTAMLLYLVVGSGLLIGGLSGGPAAGLLSQAIAVGGGLAVLIAVLIGVSGAHFNPAVTIASSPGSIPVLVLVQMSAALAATVMASSVSGSGSIHKEVQHVGNPQQ